MKKLALAIGLGAYVVFSASANSLAALRTDTASGVAAIRDSRIAWSITGTNARLLFLNEALYPETTAAAPSSPGAHGDQERADMAQPYGTSTETQRLFCDGDICVVP
jgi:hypothetical protein